MLLAGGYVLLMSSACGGVPESPTLMPASAPTPGALISPLESPMLTPTSAPTLGALISPFELLVPGISILELFDVVYDIRQEGSRHIYRKPPGRPPRRLTTSGVSNVEPRWSPDGAQIAYTASIEPGRYEIYLMNADGSAPRRLLQRDFGYNWAASWSPDGQQILFSSNYEGFAHLYVVGLDGSTPRRLTHEGNNFLGAWSPDGKRIAFTSDRGGEGDNEIYIMNADGSGVEPLTSNAVDDAAPAWSPDGRYIAYHSYESGVHNIYVYDLQQRRSWALTREGLPVRFPSWTPDGRYVLATQQVGQDEYVGVVIAFPRGQIIERLPGAERLQARLSN